METAGTFLKNHRVKKKRSIKDIAGATKISATTLEAIEGGRKEFLPPPSYLRGFLKLYAQELELDPDEVVMLYEKELMGQEKLREQKEIIAPGDHFKPWLPVVFAVIVIIVIALVLYFALRGEKPAPDAEGYRPGSETTTVSEVMPNTDAQPGAPEEQLIFEAQPQEALEPAAGNITGDNASDNQAGKKDAAGEFTLRFAAQEMSWVRIVADEQSPYEITLRPGESHRQSAVKSLKVRIGNPGGISLFFNEKPLGAAGEKGKPADLQFPEAVKKLKSAEY